MEILRYFRGLLYLLFLLAGSSCSEEDVADISEDSVDNPRLLSFTLRSNQNLNSLIEDVTGNIIGDSIVECWIPYLVSDRAFKAEVQYVGGGHFYG